MMRPSSAASNCSTASYHTANTVAISNTAAGPAGQYQGHHPMIRYNNNCTPPATNGGGFVHHGHHQFQGGGGSGPPPQTNGQYHHPQQQSGGLIRPTGRYPMPPRSSRGSGTSGTHMVRSVPTRAVGGNTYTSHHHGQPHYLQQHLNYGPMPPHYEYQPTNFQHQQQQEPNHHAHPGSVPPPSVGSTTASSPMDMDSNKQTSKENQSTDTADGARQYAINEELSASTARADEDQYSTRGGDFDQLSREVEAAADMDYAEQTDSQKGVQQQESGMHQSQAHVAQQHHHPYQQQQHLPHDVVSSYGSGQTIQQHYHHQQGYPREQHFQHSYYHPNAHQTYSHSHHQQHAGMVYSQHGGPTQTVRYGNYHPGVSPPPPQQAAVQYHPSEYHLDPAAAQNGHYAMYPQDHQHYQHGHVAVQPPPEGAFQLPNYTARHGSYNPSPETTIDTQTLSRSPSPPPKPPLASPQNKPKLLEKAGKLSTASSESGKTALGERGRNTAVASAIAKPTVKKEDATADAASILLQLGAPVLKAGAAENENPQPSDEGPKPPIPRSVQGSNSMDEASEMTHPDLTSEPSHDSLEQAMQSRVLDSEFPCPIPAKYPTRLCLPYDGAKLNSLHCFLRSDLLEIFVVQKSPHKSPTHSPHSSIGRVGLRCVHCAMSRQYREDRDEAPMAVFYPKSVAEIYRLVTSWQRCHLRKCRNLPPAVRTKWLELRETDKSRGKTHYWVTSAKEIGLRDCQGRAGGIRFGPDFDGSQLPPQTRPATYTPELTKVVERSRKPPRGSFSNKPLMSVEDKTRMSLVIVQDQDVPLKLEESCQHTLASTDTSMHTAGEQNSPPRSRMRLPMQNPLSACAAKIQEVEHTREQVMSDPPGTKVEGEMTPLSTISADANSLAVL
jgi:hypothetical protein